MNKYMTINTDIFLGPVTTLLIGPMYYYNDGIACFIEY